jgi:hypothetical protein
VLTGAELVPELVALVRATLSEGEEEPAGE